MKFLTDENIASSVAMELRNQKFDVKDVKEEGLFGISDRDIIDLALKEKRIIITHDKDFLHIVSASHFGVILIRMRKQDPIAVSRTLLLLLSSSMRKKLVGNVSVVSEHQVVIHRQ